MVQKYEAIIHRDDRLSIIVNSKNPELSLPFNMSGSRSYSVEADGSISNNEVGVLSDEKEKGYLVDINGNIDFPVLGQLHDFDLAYSDPDALHTAPHDTPVRRLDEVGAARNMILRYSFAQ